MKKLIKKSIVMVIMLTTMLGNANESKFIPVKNELKKTTITLENVKQGHKLVIKDSNGLVLYKELIKDSGTYYKGFDLTSLPNGEYYFELNKDVEIKIIPFTVTSNKVTFIKEKESSIFKPVIRVSKNRVLISRLSMDLSPLKIKVYKDSAHNDYLVYSETIKNTKVVERIYRLPKKGDGSYKIVFESDGREFIEYINI